MPACFRNHGNYVVSLGNVCRWLGQQAEALGVDIFPGFAAAEVLYDEHGAVTGVATGDMGVGKDGEPGPNFQPGMELRAKYTFFAEGCRGQLGRQLLAKYRLDEDSDPQVYGIGLKELWQIQPEKHQSGLVIHTAAGRSMRTPTAAPSCITWKTTWCASASSSASATPIRT